MSSNKDFFSGIISKLSILVGGAVLATGAKAATAQPEALNIAPDATTIKTTAEARKPLPEKLTLKQKMNGFRLIAAHGSHSSHASHASHSSHSSRAA